LEYLKLERKKFMEIFTLELPVMFGDHHVIEVKRILQEMPGVQEVYASSAFQAVEVSYDPEKVTPDGITDKLNENGYLGELSMPAETGVAGYHNENSQTYFRHTEVYENVQQVVSFGQNVSYSGRALWPCPGVGPIRRMELEEE
jgi:copper chaperone CopZ